MGHTTKKNEINLNINLMKAPINVIEYVILHEMCHLKIHIIFGQCYHHICQV